MIPQTTELGTTDYETTAQGLQDPEAEELLACAVDWELNVVLAAITRHGLQCLPRLIRDIRLMLDDVGAVADGIDAEGEKAPRR